MKLMIAIHSLIDLLFTYKPFRLNTIIRHIKCSRSKNIKLVSELFKKLAMTAGSCSARNLKRIENQLDSLTSFIVTIRNGD